MSFPVRMCHSRDEDWLLKRAAGIGASEGAAILGLHPYRSRMDVFLEKLGLKEEDPDEKREERMAWGNWMEPHVREFFSERSKRRIIEHGALYRDAQIPWLLATPDGLFDDEEKGPGLLEIKSVSRYALKEHWSEGPPEWVDIQVQHGLRVMRHMFVNPPANYGTIVVVSDGPPVWWDVPYREEWVENVYLPELEAFWNAVQMEELPDPDGSESCKKALRSLYRPEHYVEPPDPVHLDGTFLGLDGRRQEIAAEIKKLTAEKAKLDQQIKAALKGHAIGILPDGTRYEWRLTERAGYVVQPTKYDTLKRFKSPRGE